MLQAGSRVKAHIVATLDDGSVVYSTHLQGGLPHEIIIGQRQVLPAVEEQLATMEAGEQRTFTVAAADAYGTYDPTLIETVEAAKIPNADDLPVGGYVVFSTEEGPLRVKVAKIEDGIVTFDYNHELADHDITYKIDVVKVLANADDAVDSERYFNEKECGCKSAFGHGCDHDHDCEHSSDCGA